jgi:hypothetical protein
MWFVVSPQGSPDEFSQGEFNGLTLWEQLDGGEAWTSTKCVPAARS